MTHDPNTTEGVAAQAILDATVAIKRLRAALAYYAAPYHWDGGDVPGHIYAHDDAGRLARETLGLPRNIPPGERFEVELECRRIMDGGDHV